MIKKIVDLEMMKPMSGSERKKLLKSYDLIVYNEKDFNYSKLVSLFSEKQVCKKADFFVPCNLKSTSDMKDVFRSAFLMLGRS